MDRPAAPTPEAPIMTTTATQQRQQTPSPALVTQWRLRELFKAQEAADVAKRAAETAAAVLEDRRAGVLELVDAGAPVEPGTLALTVETTAGRRNVAWRAAYENIAGKAMAAKLLASTDPGPGRRYPVATRAARHTPTP
jgi:hypothetical protein